MTITSEVQSAIKSDKAIIGYKETIKNIKASTVKVIVIANNMPAKMKREIEHNAKIAGMKMEIFDGDSKQLGIVCGKPFPISAMAIRG